MVIFFVYWLPWVQVRLLPEGQQEQFELHVALTGLLLQGAGVRIDEGQKYLLHVSL